MATISQLRKQAQSAPKYIISMLMFGEVAYIADTEKTKQNCEFTFHKSEAMEFSVGWKYRN